MKYSYDDPIIEYWTANDEDVALPPGQGNAKRKWHGTIMLAGLDGVIEEYEIFIDRKVRLNDYLKIVFERLSEIADPGTQECGFKIW